jgi:hypothetical protein
MIRLAFVLFVTLGGFAAAALWSSRNEDATPLAEKIVSPELTAAVAAEVERLRSPEQKPEPPPAAGPPEEPAAQASRAPAPTAPARPSAAAPPHAATGPSVARGGAGGSAAPDTPDDESVIEVEVVTAREEFARDFGPVATRGRETAVDVLPGDSGIDADAPYPADVAQPPDPDRSARLIRRMLAVYRSSGANR